MKSAKTIDEKHTEMLLQFSKNKIELIPQLNSEINTLKLRLQKIKKNANIDEYMNIKDKIKQNQNEIKSLTTQEKQYYLDNAKYIFIKSDMIGCFYRIPSRHTH